MHTGYHLFILGKACPPSSILLVSSSGICRGIVGGNIRIREERSLSGVEWKEIVSARKPRVIQHLSRLLLRSAIVDRKGMSILC